MPTSTGPRSAAEGRAGRGLRGDDVVEHFIATTNHHWLLFFTTAGRVYRTKAYNLPGPRATPRAGHVAGLLSFQPDEHRAQVLAIRDYEQAPYLVLATRAAAWKKTRLATTTVPAGGRHRHQLPRDDDELIGAELVEPADDILLVSRKGQPSGSRADDAQLRPMGRATSGVTGMKFRSDADSMLSMSVIQADQVGGRGGRREAGRQVKSTAAGDLPT